MLTRPLERELVGLSLFADVTPSELGGLEEHWTVEHHTRGQYVFRRGEPGDALYVIQHGQVAMEVGDSDAPRLLGLCGPGDWFGEMALLSSADRSADARVMIDATLLKLDRDGWALLGARAPRLFARLCTRLSAQLRTQNEPQAVTRRTVGCVESREWIGALARSIRRQFPRRPVHVLAADGSVIDDADAKRDGRAPDHDALASAVTRVVAPDAIVLIASDARADGVADHHLRRAAPALWTLEPGVRGRSPDIVRGTSADAALDRVARRIAGGTVGLALGAGGAFGFAHLGLLAELEREGIPVDVIAGASMGAILGAGAAVGVPAERWIEYACSLATRYRSIVLQDLDIRGRTLLRGRSVTRILRDVDELRDATFEDLILPFLAIAMDVHSGAEVILDTGPLIEGITPSFAMPGIFPSPVVHGRTLVDGAMVNPVPVNHVRALGADVVIASQPIPPLGASGEPFDQILGRGRRFVDWIPLGPFRQGLASLGVTLRSFQSLWYHLAISSSQAADVVFAPDLHDFWFLQFSAASAIIELGRRHAAALVPEIRATLAVRVGLDV